VGNDTQVIPHPVLRLSGNLKAIQKFELKNAAAFNLTVPQFFDTSHGYVNNGNDGNGHASIFAPTWAVVSVS
jgi:C1A family cysteine protease